jgi:DNA-binding NarL/FixJ family response regulator
VTRRRRSTTPRHAGSSRTDASSCPLPKSARASRFGFGDDQYVVVAFDAPEPAPSLSPAEREVARLVFAGLSNTDIAIARSTSHRTVANQIAAIFRKLGVASRAELAARIASDSRRQR